LSSREEDESIELLTTASTEELFLLLEEHIIVE